MAASRSTVPARGDVTPTCGAAYTRRTYASVAWDENLLKVGSMDITKGQAAMAAAVGAATLGVALYSRSHQTAARPDQGTLPPQRNGAPVTVPTEHRTPTTRTHPPGTSFVGQWTVQDHTTGIVSHQSLFGQWSLLYFGSAALSPDKARKQLTRAKEALDAVESRSNMVGCGYLVSLAPEHDSTDKLQAVVQQVQGGMKGKILGLTGQQTAKVAEAVRRYRDEVAGTTEDIEEHLYLVGPHGEFCKIFDAQCSPGQIAEFILSHPDPHAIHAGKPAAAP